MLGRHLSELYVPGSASAFVSERKVAESQGSHRADRWIRRLDGSQFWGEVNEPIFKWLYEQKRITRPLTAQDFAKAVDSRFMQRTFAKLGWNVPKEPPFLPVGWKGSPSKPPYPEYIHPINTTTPQPFPGQGDLAKAWTFGGKTFNP